MSFGNLWVPPTFITFATSAGLEQNETVKWWAAHEEGKRKPFYQLLGFPS